VLLLLADFSELELPLGEVSLDAEFDDECSNTTGAATTAGAGTTTIGADPITMARVPCVRVWPVLRPTPTHIDSVGNLKNQCADRAPSYEIDSQLFFA
jgi:hypothetical protein